MCMRRIEIVFVLKVNPLSFTLDTSRMKPAFLIPTLVLILVSPKKKVRPSPKFSGLKAIPFAISIEATWLLVLFAESLVLLFFIIICLLLFTLQIYVIIFNQQQT